MPSLRRRDAILVVVIGTSLWGAALAVSTAKHAAVDAAVLLPVYLLVVAAGHCLAVGAGQRSILLAWLGASPLAAIAVWHLRELWLFESGIPAVALAVLLSSGLYALALRYSRPEVGTRVVAALAGALAFALLAVATMGAAFFSSSTLRWHLLRHHKLLGTPAYYVFADRIDSICEGLWSRYGRSQPTAAHSPVEQRASLRPNLVFALVDTLRADGLELYGGDPAVMPRLNQIARQSFVFSDVVANASWTRPSVASMFTGLQQEQHGAVDRDNVLPERRLTLAERLQARGYRTAAFVANFGAVGRDAGFAQGFDRFEEIQEAGLPYASAERVNAHALAWLREASNRQEPPVFVYLHYMEPHSSTIWAGKSRLPHPGSLRGAYDRQLRTFDDAFSKFVEELDASIRRPLLLFVTSDHGEEFGEHGEGGHGHALYSEVSRIPALLRTDSRQHALLASRLEGRDFHDLLLALADDPELDVMAWSSSNSRSVRYYSIYLSATGRIHRPYFSRICMRALQSGRWLAIWSAYGPTLELYDLASDPNQRRDQSRREPELAARLEREMLEIAGSDWARRDRRPSQGEPEAQLRALGYVE